MDIRAQAVSIMTTTTKMRTITTQMMTSRATIATEFAIAFDTNPLANGRVDKIREKY